LLVSICLSSIIFDEVSFRWKVAGSNKRMQVLGGGFHNGRREASTHLTVWCHSPDFTDDNVATVVDILQEWERDGRSTRHDVDLSRTGITDRSLAVLERLQRLDRLDVSGTHVTAKARIHLQQRFPDLAIQITRPDEQH